MNARPLASGSTGRGNRASMTAIRWVVCSGSSGGRLAPALSLSPSDPILRSASATGACVVGPVKERSRKRRSGDPALPSPARPFCPAATADRRGGGGSSLPPSSLQGLDADQRQPRVRRHRRRCFATTIALTVTETRSEAVGCPVPNATQHRYTDPTVAEKRL